MKLELPDDVLRIAELTARELRVAMAIQLYADHRIDHSDACRLAGVAPGLLNTELLQRDIGVNRFPKPPKWQDKRAG